MNRESHVVVRDGTMSVGPKPKQPVIATDESLLLRAGN